MIWVGASLVFIGIIGLKLENKRMAEERAVKTVAEVMTILAKICEEQEVK